MIRCSCKYCARYNPDEPQGVPEHIYYKKGSKTVCTSAVLAAFGIDACSYHYSGQLKQRLAILRKNGWAARSRNSHITRGYRKLKMKRGDKSVGAVRRIIAHLNDDSPETNAWGDPIGTRYMIRVEGHALLLDYDGQTIVDTDPRVRDRRKVLDIRAVFRMPEQDTKRRNPAKTLNSNVGVAVLGKPHNSRAVVLLDLTKLHSEEDLLDSLLSYIYFGYEEEDLCPGNYYVAQKAVALHGWGPITFELAMQVTVSDGMKGLVPDRREISEDGFKIWRRFYERDDITKTPLPAGAMWGEDFLDQSYKLQSHLSFYAARVRARRHLREIFPYADEAETLLWEAGEAWFREDFGGGRYRPSSPSR